MTEDEIIELGGTAEHICLSPYFNRLVEAWEQQRTAQFLSSKPEETNLREFYYTQLTGVRQFIDYLATVAAEGRVLARKQMPKPDDIDDPSVHEIYSPDDQRGLD